MTTARNACVIGWPAAHSRSPLIHNYWIKQYGLDGEYRREEVRPEKFAVIPAGNAAELGRIDHVKSGVPPSTVQVLLYGTPTSTGPVVSTHVILTA